LIIYSTFTVLINKIRMCLALEGIVKDIKDKNHAIVDFGGSSQDITSFLLTDIKNGDTVMVHAGFILEKPL